MFSTKKSVLRKLEYWMAWSYAAFDEAPTADDKKAAYAAAMLFYTTLMMDYPKHQQVLTQAWENNYEPLFVERLKEVGVEVE